MSWKVTAYPRSMFKGPTEFSRDSEAEAIELARFLCTLAWCGGAVVTRPDGIPCRYIH